MQYCILTDLDADSRKCCKVKIILIERCVISFNNDLCAAMLLRNQATLIGFL